MATKFDVMGSLWVLADSCFRRASELRSFSCNYSKVIAESQARTTNDMSLNSSPRPFKIFTVRSSGFSRASSMASSPMMLFACCIYYMIDWVPLVMLVRTHFRCMMCPLEGLV